MGKIDNTFVKINKDGKFDPVLSKPEGMLTAHRDQTWFQTSVPCHTACPAGTDVPGYLQAVREGDYDKAYRINLRDNVFPAVLGRVCTRPCEPACRHGRAGLGESVAICFAKRSAADFRDSHTPVVLEPLFAPTNKRIAVIGAGPGGLSVARELALFGHQVCIYEKHDKPGGMLSQGIPEFRLPRDIVEIEIEQILALGIDLVCGVEIGKETVLSDLSDEYDAVVVATGAHQPWTPPFEGRDLDGVHHGFNFIRDVNRHHRVEIGSSVVVVGGGFTAVDCAQAASYLGADQVELVYRRSQDQMRCSETEIARLREDGIDLTMHTTPAGFRGQDRVREVELKATNRENACWRQEADTVLLATGQRRAFRSMDPTWGPALERQWLNGEGQAHHFPDSNLFACGDARWGAQTIIDAIGDAKRCARVIDSFLMDLNRFQDGLRLKTLTSTGRDRSCNEIPRQEQDSTPVTKRGLTHEIDEGLDPETSRQEAWRCYMCNQKVEIETRDCVSCGLCLMVMPVEDCIVQLKRTDDDSYTVIHDFESYDALAVDQDRCIRCNACRESCPVDCISLQVASPIREPQAAPILSEASLQR